MASQDQLNRAFLLAGVTIGDPNQGTDADLEFAPPADVTVLRRLFKRSLIATLQRRVGETPESILNETTVDGIGYVEFLAAEILQTLAGQNIDVQGRSLDITNTTSGGFQQSFASPEAARRELLRRASELRTVARNAGGEALMVVQGPPGPKGDDGRDGDRGPEGPEGPVGPMGAKGEDGVAEPFQLRELTSSGSGRYAIAATDTVFAIQLDITGALAHRSTHVLILRSGLTATARLFITEAANPSNNRNPYVGFNAAILGSNLIVTMAASGVTATIRRVSTVLGGSGGGIGSFTDLNEFLVKTETGASADNGKRLIDLLRSRYDLALPIPSRSTEVQVWKSRNDSAFWEAINEVPDTPGTSTGVGHVLTVIGENDTDYAWRAPTGGGDGSGRGPVTLRNLTADSGGTDASKRFRTASTDTLFHVAFTYVDAQNREIGITPLVIERGALSTTAKRYYLEFIGFTPIEGELSINASIRINNSNVFIITTNIVGQNNTVTRIDAVSVVEATGAVGPQGPAGTPGPAGGPPGPQGPQGPQGEPGEQGPIGSPGTPGERGPEGPRGFEGPIGRMGERGDPGPQGIQGFPGVQGPKGDRGDTGAQGIPGTAAEKGDTGDRGPVGPQGVRGDQGPQGVPGAQGPKGDRGDTGLTGPRGDQGPQGVPGTAAEKGDKGDRGDTGPQGPKGDRGDQGPQGVPGTTAEKGDKGDPGDRGPVGPQGVKGDQGAQGVAGPQGRKGDRGDTGPAGPQGAQGSTGATGPQGLKGDRGDTGPAGPQGIRGNTGATGATGPKGDRGDSSISYAVPVIEPAYWLLNNVDRDYKITLDPTLVAASTRIRVQVGSVVVALITKIANQNVYTFTTLTLTARDINQNFDAGDNIPVTIGYDGINDRQAFFMPGVDSVPSITPSFAEPFLDPSYWLLTTDARNVILHLDPNALTGATAFTVRLGGILLASNQPITSGDNVYTLAVNATAAGNLARNNQDGESIGMDVTFTGNDNILRTLILGRSAAPGGGGGGGGGIGTEVASGTISVSATQTSLDLTTLTIVPTNGKLMALRLYGNSKNIPLVYFNWGSGTHPFVLIRFFNSRDNLTHFFIRTTNGNGLINIFRSSGNVISSLSIDRMNWTLYDVPE